MKNNAKKELIFFLVIGLVLWNVGCMKTSYQDSIELDQKKKESFEKPVIVKENMVVFIELSQSDADLLLKENPEFELALVTKLSDFESYYLWISKILDKMGITNTFAVSKQIWFQYSNGKIKKMRFNPKDVYGMALFAKGKKPKLVSAFGAHIEPMAKIISEYFGVEVNWEKK